MFHIYNKGTHSHHIFKLCISKYTNIALLNKTYAIIFLGRYQIEALPQRAQENDTSFF